MLSHELRGVLIGRIVTHKAATMAREVKARRAELNEANKKMKEAKDSARAFEGDLKAMFGLVESNGMERNGVGLSQIPLFGFVKNEWNGV
ncbi:hypothetical protein A2U01_0018705 [Trifolium medium]|uniref:Uncharacterized protein n=1 Tax=Trifolium medium TaxID=97028 RepID=A0A392NET4_9FABA|nr:hypothetical protein [Trifolium medium]